MRILHVAGGSINAGGVEKVIVNLYKNINRSRFIFDVAYHSSEDIFTDKIKELGGKVFICKKPKDIGIWAYYKQIKTLLKNNGPYDVVHVHTTQYIGLALIAAISVGVKKRVSHLHSTTKNMKKTARNFLMLLYTWCSIALFSTEILAVSNEAAKSYVRFGRKYKILHNSFDPEPFINVNTEAIEAVRKEFSFINGKKVIGTVGRCSASKNHSFIVKLAEKLNKYNELVFVIVGDGELFEQTKSDINKKRLNNIILLGYRKDIPALLKIFDMFILPSLYEGLSLCVLEAQLAGVKSIVSTAVPTEADLNMGLVRFISLNDMDAWIAEITKTSKCIIPPPETRKQMFFNKGYDMKDMINKLEGIYIND